MTANRAIVVTSYAEQPEDHCRFIGWMSDRLALDGVFKVEDSIAIAHVEFTDDMKAEILGVVAINNWSPAACEGHIASDGSGRWMSRKFARFIYSFVFKHAGKSRFNFVVGVDNLAAVRMHDKLGHERMCRLADAYGEDKDAYLYGLTRKQWLAGKYAEPSTEA